MPHPSCLFPLLTTAFSGELSALPLAAQPHPLGCKLLLVFWPRVRCGAGTLGQHTAQCLLGPGDLLGPHAPGLASLVLRLVVSRGESPEPHNTSPGCPHQDKPGASHCVGAQAGVTDNDHSLGIYPGAPSNHLSPSLCLRVTSSHVVTCTHPTGVQVPACALGQPGPATRPSWGLLGLQHQADPEAPWADRSHRVTADIVLDMGWGPEKGRASRKGVVWPQVPH